MSLAQKEEFEEVVEPKAPIGVTSTLQKRRAARARAMGLSIFQEGADAQSEGFAYEAPQAEATIHMTRASARHAARDRAQALPKDWNVIPGGLDIPRSSGRARKSPTIVFEDSAAKASVHGVGNRDARREARERAMWGSTPVESTAKPTTRKAAAKPRAPRASRVPKTLAA